MFDPEPKEKLKCGVTATGVQFSLRLPLSWTKLGGKTKISASFSMFFPLGNRNFPWFLTDVRIHPRMFKGKSAGNYGFTIQDGGVQ